MSKKSVFCLATSRNQADQILDHLRSESFSKNDISVLFSDQDTTRELTSESITKAAAGAVAVAGTGSFIGKPLGWILGPDVLHIPGLGAFIAAGPIVAALSGSTGGGLVGGLMGLGIPELEAKRYEGKVKNGNLLISVNTGDVGDIARAKDIFKQAGARDICTPGGATTKGGASSELLAAA